MTPAPWDIDAWYRRYAPMVYRRCLQLLADRELAADCMQEVFVRVAQARPDVQTPSALLNRIATHVCLNTLRNSRSRTPKDAEAAGPVLAQDLERRISALRVLDWIFGTEPDSTRTIVILRHLDGMTLE